jgi:hypothetical protein
VTSPTPEIEPDDHLQEFLNTLGDLLTRLTPLHRLFDKYGVTAEEGQPILNEIRYLLIDTLDAWNGFLAIREQQRRAALIQVVEAREQARNAAIERFKAEDKKLRGITRRGQ